MPGPTLLMTNMCCHPGVEELETSTPAPPPWYQTALQITKLLICNTLSYARLTGTNTVFSPIEPPGGKTVV